LYFDTVIAHGVPEGSRRHFAKAGLREGVAWKCPIRVQRGRKALSLTTVAR
jgi:hypothetical protein